MLVSRKTLVFMLPSGRLVIWNLTVGNLKSITLQNFMSSTLTFRTPPFYPSLYLRGLFSSSEALSSHVFIMTRCPRYSPSVSAETLQLVQFLDCRVEDRVDPGDSAFYHNTREIPAGWEISFLGIQF